MMEKRGNKEMKIIPVKTVALMIAVLISVSMFGGTGVKCDPSIGRELLKKAETLYDIRGDGTKPFQIVMNYSGLDYENKEIETKISYYFESNDKWREEIETPSCKSILIKTGNSFYVPETQPAEGGPNVCSSLIMMEPLSLFEHFKLIDSDRIECYLNKLEDGTDVIDIYIAFGQMSDEKNAKVKGHTKPLFSKALRFEKESMKLLLINSSSVGMFSEIVKCKEMNGKIVPIYIQKNKDNKLLGQWVITRLEVDTPIDPELFNTGSGFKESVNIKNLESLQPPKIIVDAQPRYPEEALRFGISGKVVVQVVIDEKGNVSDARIIKATSPMFARAALVAALKWRFSPCTDIKGNKVKVYFIRVINFKAG